MDGMIFRASQWFDINEMKIVHSVQAVRRNHFPRVWMHVLENGSPKIFTNKTEQTRWLNKSRKKPPVKKKHIDPHLGCFAYPNCDEDPNGCSKRTKPEDVDSYGHKD